MQFGGRFIPVHFVGALVEGVAPSGGWNINYQAGIGNGRGNVISRAGDAGDNNDVPALSGQCVHEARPLFRSSGRGIGIFRSQSPPSDGPTTTNGSSRATRCGSTRIRRSSPKSRTSGTPRSGPRRRRPVWGTTCKARIDCRRRPGSGSRTSGSSTSDIDSNDIVFTGVPNLDGSILGVRFDISTYVGDQSRGPPSAASRINRGRTADFFQIAFTF